MVPATVDVSKSQNSAKEKRCNCKFAIWMNGWLNPEISEPMEKEEHHDLKSGKRRQQHIQV
jgi:hypothetical protein